MPPRTLVVGDIQGCCDELEDLLAAIGFVEGADQIVSVGDLVNRGPRSLDVLRLFRQLGGETVLGNHEIHLLELAAGMRASGDTLGDVLSAEDLPDLLDWLVDRPEPLVMLRAGWTVVHAGLPPSFNLPDDAWRANEGVRAIWRSGQPLTQRVAVIRSSVSVQFLTRVRYCNPHGARPDDDGAEDPPGFRPWFDLREPGPIIAFGHWARLDPARAARPDLRFLDTGCVYGGALTGWLVEEDRRVSVPARRQYWPKQ
jgi:bis(5'-nucleosyl)-tetraphosphatase (symmetrical)